MSGPPGAPRILTVFTALPVVHDVGVRVRNAHVLFELARRGEVHLALSEPRIGPGDVPPEVGAACASITLLDDGGDRGGALARWRSTWSAGRAARQAAAGRLPERAVPYVARLPGLLDRALRAAGTAPIDVVWLGHTFLGLGAARLRRRHPRARLACDVHGVEARFEQLMARDAADPRDRARHEAQSRACAQLERRVLHAVDAALCLSDVEAGELRRLAPDGRLIVNRNHVDVDFFRAGRASDPRPTILFPAGMTLAPNVVAARWLAREVLPRVRQRVADAQLILAGRRCEERCAELSGDPGVELVSYLPDMRPLFERASVVAVPVRAGCGASRLKIGEALAMARPVVSTAYGAEGWAEDGAPVALAEDADGFAAALAERLADPARCAREGAAGRAWVATHRTWSALAPAVTEATGLPVAATGRPGLTTRAGRSGATGSRRRRP